MWHLGKDGTNHIYSKYIQMSEEDGDSSVQCSFDSHTLRKQSYSNILRILPQKKENFRMKTGSFHISALNINCGYKLELPRQGGSNTYVPTIYVLYIYIFTLSIGTQFSPAAWLIFCLFLLGYTFPKLLCIHKWIHPSTEPWRTVRCTVC